MNKKLLKQFEKRLLGEREKLLSKLNLEKEAFVDLKRNEVGDLVDKAFTQWEKDRAIDISEVDKRNLLEIDRALSRIRTGGYGVCILCSSEIDPMRLEALPWTQTCVDPRKCRANKVASAAAIAAAAPKPAPVAAKPVAAKPVVAKPTPARAAGSKPMALSAKSRRALKAKRPSKRRSK